MTDRNDRPTGDLPRIPPEPFDPPVRWAEQAARNAARDPLDPTRLGSEGGAPEHRAALAIACPTCGAAIGRWCPMPGTTWNLCGSRIRAGCAISPDPDVRALVAGMVYP